MSYPSASYGELCQNSAWVRLSDPRERYSSAFSRQPSAVSTQWGMRIAKGYGALRRGRKFLAINISIDGRD